jgi:aryl-alcohol dehydrogenase-like predicted oxidoreductase
MKPRPLGRTGLQFFPVGLGGMPMSIAGRPDEARCLATLEAAFAAGVDFVDTANVYCLDDSDIGHNERLIAKAVKRSGRKVLVATKGGLRRPNGAWTNDASPAFLRESCEKSLAALGVEAIGLYQLHAPDKKVPFEDSIGELKRLQEEGKIVHIGLSNTGPELIERALKVARVESVQNSANPFDREDYDQGGALEACARHGLTFLPYSVVGGHRGQLKVGNHPVLAEIAKKHGATPYAVTVAWHLAQSPAVLPIPGASRPESIRDSASAEALVLDASDRARIDALAS